MNKIKSALNWIRKNPVLKAIMVWVVVLFVLAVVVDKVVMPIFSGKLDLLFRFSHSLAVIVF